MDSMNSFLSPDLFKKARRRLLQLHYEAKVGHVGSNLSCLDALLTLFHGVKKPEDLFVLSKGHAAGALYLVLWTLGQLSEEELQTFHQENSRLPGHPPVYLRPDLPFATGSLGHGLSLAAGLALGNRLQGKQQEVFCLTSDGEWQEGSTWEAFVLICHHQLNHLTVLVDLNGWQGFGTTREVASLDQLDDRLSRFPADIVRCPGHDPKALLALLQRPATRPRFVFLETVKGAGVKDFENQLHSHYLPLTEVQYRQALEALEGKE